MSPEDAHTPYLSGMIADDDWAALARYWIAHLHEPALDAAITAAQRLATIDQRWQELPSFLNAVLSDPMAPSDAPPQSLLALDQGMAQMTIQLLYLYSRATLCIQAEYFPIEHQERALRVGLEAAEHAANEALAAGEQALGASFLTKLGYGLYRVCENQRAAKVWLATLEIYRELATQRSEIYQSYVADLLDNLGNVHSRLNLPEIACAHYQEALNIHRELAKQRPGHSKAGLALILNNLSIVQSDLNNLESARDTCNEALLCYRELALQSPDDYLFRVAMTLTNLGVIQGDLDNAASARNSYVEALQIYLELNENNFDCYLPEVARTFSNLSTVQIRLDQLELARTCCKDAVALYRELAEQLPETYRPELATALNNLGIIFDALKNLEAARGCFVEALEIRRRLASQNAETYSPGIAMALNGLGQVEFELNDFQAALRSLEEAVKILESDPMSHLGVRLRERQTVWTNLGKVHRTDKGLERPNYVAARDALRRAVNYAEEFRSSFHERSLRKAIYSKMPDPYELLVETCVDLWVTQQDHSALNEAVHVAEQSRSRNLVERLSEEDFAPRNAPMERFTAFLRLRRELEAAKLALEIERSQPRDNSPKPLSHEDEPRERLSSPENVKRHFSGLRRMLRSPQSLGGAAVSADEEAPLELSGEAAAVIAEAETHLAALAKELRQADAEWDPDRPVKPLTGAEIQALIPMDTPTAFVQFTLFEETGVALIITRRSVKCVRLPSLSYRTISEAALEWFTTYYDRAENPCDWEDKMDMRLASVGTALLPLWLALEESSIHRIILSPNRWLHIFPLHACMLVDGRRRAADAFEISYTPSFSVLGRCVRRTRGVTGPALAIGNPTGDLHFTEAEIAAARCHYPKVHVLDQSSATKAAIFADAPECWLVLYTGHATFDIENPVLSSLVLETKDQTQRAKWLSLGDAFCHLNLGKCALAILNGCESGLLLPDRTDEYLALSSGFLHAGAVCVLSSQWAVHDLSAALLMDRFHAKWRGGKSAAGALREAARWLREDIRNGTDLIARVLPEFLREIPEGSALHDACLARAHEYAVRAGASPPFASPAHWAAFSAVGKAW